MERNNRRKSSQSRRLIRKNRRKRKGLKSNTIIIILFTFIISIILIYISINLLKSIMFSNDNSNSDIIAETKIENIDGNIATNSDLNGVENTNRIIQDIIDSQTVPSKTIKQNIESFIDVNKLQNDKINVLYSSGDDIYIKDENKRVPMRNYNLYIISMILEDLENQGKINLNKSVDLSEFYEEKVENKPLSVLVKEMIIMPDDQGVKALTNEVKNIVNMEWKEYANGRFSINIDDENTMSIKDISTMLNLLISKENDEFKYKDTISYMKEATKIRSDLTTTKEVDFIGMEGAVLYEYSIESGYVLKEKPYIYFIYAQYSDNSVLVEIRNIITKEN